MQHLIELPYWPPVSWATLALHSEVLWLETQEHFQKGSFRNRCHLAGPNGVQRLSIPLQKGKHQQTPIRDVRIEQGEAWQQVHWRSIQTAYGNAPYFEHFADAVEGLYRKPVVFLFDLNLEIIDLLCTCLSWTIPKEFTTAFQPFRPGALLDNPKAIDQRNSISPKRSTPPEWFLPCPYPQVFMEKHGFLPDLSLLDLLFCCGKQSTEILERSWRSGY